ncbi:MAG: hypothetical protein M3N95_06500 [Actinomycetota bacterium]|nr:hypothetical protein [Actinomycetota bacterium]
MNNPTYRLIYRVLFGCIALAGLIVGLATHDWTKARVLFLVALLWLAFYGVAYLRTGGWGSGRDGG